MEFSFQIYTDNYEIIMKNYISDDQETDLTFTNLTVQFLTVKSIAHFLLQNTNVFPKLIDIYTKRLMDHVKDIEQDKRDSSKKGHVTKQRPRYMPRVWSFSFRRLSSRFELGFEYHDGGGEG